VRSLSGKKHISAFAGFPPQTSKFLLKNDISFVEDFEDQGNFAEILCSLYLLTKKELLLSLLLPNVKGFSFPEIYSL